MPQPPPLKDFKMLQLETRVNTLPGIKPTSFGLPARQLPLLKASACVRMRFKSTPAVMLFKPLSKVFFQTVLSCTSSMVVLEDIVVGLAEQRINSRRRQIAGVVRSDVGPGRRRDLRWA